MHWANPKTKDRMLPETGGSSNLQAQGNPQMRRASEGGAALYFGWVARFLLVLSSVFDNSSILSFSNENGNFSKGRDKLSFIAAHLLGEVRTIAIAQAVTLCKQF